MKFSLYRIIYNGQQLIQNLLYLISDRYRINFVAFFEYLEDKDYVVIKLDSPNIHSRFPYKYKIGTDIDIIVLKKDIDEIIQKFTLLNKDKKLKCNILTHESSVKIRYQFYKFLNIELDLQYVLKNELYRECLSLYDLQSNIKIPSVNNEILIRAIEYQAKPHKLYHLNYIIKNKKYIDFDLMNYYGITPNTIKKINDS